MSSVLCSGSMDISPCPGWQIIYHIGDWCVNEFQQRAKAARISSESSDTWLDERCFAGMSGGANVDNDFIVHTQ